MTDCRVCLKPLSTWPMGQKGDFKFVACKACGSVMMEPFPTKEALDAYFKALDPKPVPDPDPQGTIGLAKKRIMKVTKGFTGKRFLDISARQGYAVEAAKELGYEARGIDTHEFLVKFAQEKYGVEYFSRSSAQDYSGQADLIFSIQSFCEQPDIESFTAALAKILAPGGRLHIEEPDGNSIWLPKTFTRAPFVLPPVNFIYLSFPGMQQLLARHGLKIEHKFFTWAPYMRLIVTK